MSGILFCMIDFIREWLGRNMLLSVDFGVGNFVLKLG